MKKKTKKNISAMINTNIYDEPKSVGSKVYKTLAYNATIEYMNYYVAVQILNFEFTIKEEKDWCSKLIVECLKNFNVNVSSCYYSNGFDKRLEKASDKSELFHPIRELMDSTHCERIFAEYFHIYFLNITEDDRLYGWYIEFLDFLEIHHKGIFQYMAGKGYINEHLIENT